MDPWMHGTDEGGWWLHTKEGGGRLSASCALAFDDFVQPSFMQYWPFGKFCQYTMIRRNLRNNLFPLTKLSRLQQRQNNTKRESGKR